LVREKLKLVGVDCPSCVYAINREFAKLGCVEEFKFDLSTGEAIIVYNDSICGLNDVYRGVRNAGYDVVKEVAVFVVEDLDTGLASYIEKRLCKTTGIFDCISSVSTSTVKVVYNPYTLSSSDVEKVFSGLGVGFRKLLEESIARGKAFEKSSLLRRVLSFSIGVAVVSIAIASMLMNIHISYNYVYYLAIASSVVIALNYDILRRGFAALARLSPTMDSLVSLSTTISFLFGLASLLGVAPKGSGLSTESFFEASAGVLGFVGFGLYLEERIRRSAWSSVEDLVKRLYSKARVVVGDKVVEVDAEKVSLESVVEIRAGEIIPVDGVVVDGDGYVDESSFTGEPLPVHKSAKTRDPVLAGTILVSGYLRVRATRVGRETMLYRIIETIREAQFYKPKALRVADKFVGVFTWLVIALGISVLLYWGIIVSDFAKAIMFTATVFATACPCAIGIAVPMAVSIAVVAASRKGVVIRRGDVFDRLLEASTIIFDKTGTLTIGKPHVENIWIVNNAVDEKTLLFYICSVESRSEHPIAKAITDFCKEKGVEIEDVEEFNQFPGLGVIGVVNGVAVAVGNMELLNRLGVEEMQKLRDFIDSISSRGSTPIAVALNNSLVAVIEVSDRLRPEAEKVVRYLKSLGYRIGIASGDVKGSVERYAKALQLDFYRYELKPLEKTELVKEIQSKGEKILYVGDGVNDAATISVAHVGVAMGGGADISKEAGDVVLTSNKLSDLVFIIELSKKVRRKFLENIAWAFIYNIALLPIAAGAFYSHGVFMRPEMGAAAMILSDVSVVLNSLRLLKQSTSSPI